ncbi:hypothetical protein ABEG18_12495 [Alsobacter sp. KACC 23698]|uniref:SPOR domain-containing protein n=1 Tax=Alsobacter sp. KACC 23698 TaxID=3149229 RepID=A0AAU7JM94_9HYPH
MLQPLRIEPTFAEAAPAVPLAGGAAAPVPPTAPVERAAAASAAAWAGVAVSAILLGAPCLWPAARTEPAPMRQASAADLAAPSPRPDVVATGSLAPQPAPTPAASAEPLQDVTTETFTIALGESTAAATLWGRWRFLQQAYAEEIGSLAASVRPSPNAPQRQILTLGPFANAGKAAEFCGRWRAKGASCEVARADGARLSPGT